MRLSRTAAALALAVLCVGCNQLAAPTAPTSTRRTAASGAVAATASAAVAANTHGTPFKGDLEGTVTLHFDNPPLTWWAMSGGGIATQLGKFTLHVVADLGSTIERAHGHYRFTAANGDVINGFFTGRAEVDGPVYSVVDTGTLFGGSGRFTGSPLGTFTVTRVYDPVTHRTTGTFEGTILTGHGQPR